MLDFLGFIVDIFDFFGLFKKEVPQNYRPSECDIPVQRTRDSLKLNQQPISYEDKYKHNNKKIIFIVIVIVILMSIYMFRK